MAVLVLVGAAWSLLLGPRSGAEPGAIPALLDRDRVIVEVLNGTDRRGLARHATRVLRAAGFDVIYFGSVPPRPAPTEVLARRGDAGAAVRVGRALGFGRVRLERDTLRRVDVTVLLGPDYAPPPGIRP